MVIIGRISSKKLLEVYRSIHDIEKGREVIIKLYNILFNSNHTEYYITSEYEVRRVLEEEILYRIKSGKIKLEEPKKTCETCLHLKKSPYSRECSKCYLGYEGYEENISLRRWEE